jgi:uracil-DNA glycosylase family 4
MDGMSSLQALHDDVVNCNRCRRLRSYCCDVAATKRRAFMQWDYWGKPVPGFGDPNARLWIIGLAPAAHGANRTGRVFTGDRSGDFLFAALHRAGFASQPTSTSRDDGLRLNDCFISASVRCAPPGNKPSPREQGNCAGFLDREWDSLTQKRVILALGKIAWDATIALAKRNRSAPTAKVDFGHGAQVELDGGPMLIGSYHVSQQNTFTGKLTPAMFDNVLRMCRKCFK